MFFNSFRLIILNFLVTGLWIKYRPTIDIGMAKTIHSRLKIKIRGLKINIHIVRSSKTITKGVVSNLVKYNLNMILLYRILKNRLVYNTYMKDLKQYLPKNEQLELEIMNRTLNIIGIQYKRNQELLALFMKKDISKIKTKEIAEFFALNNFFKVVFEIKGNKHWQAFIDGIKYKVEKSINFEAGRLQNLSLYSSFEPLKKQEKTVMKFLEIHNEYKKASLSLLIKKDMNFIITQLEVNDLSLLSFMLDCLAQDYSISSGVFPLKLLPSDTDNKSLVQWVKNSKEERKALINDFQSYSLSIFESILLKNK